MRSAAQTSPFACLPVVALFAGVALIASACAEPAGHRVPASEGPQIGGGVTAFDGTYRGSGVVTTRSSPLCGSVEPFRVQLTVSDGAGRLPYGRGAALTGAVAPDGTFSLRPAS